MYLCIHICTYVYMCVCVYVCIYVCVCVCLFVCLGELFFKVLKEVWHRNISGGLQVLHFLIALPYKWDTLQMLLLL